MIPRTIQIQNFLSYGHLQTINFNPYHLICLSGKNGHGKSALLDAITWALWGQARKIAATVRADQGLLRLGQSTMMVILDFEVHATLYRVKRVFELVYGQPKVSLEFGMYKDEHSYIPLTEKTIRTTQTTIEKTVGLTFDTFINSAFLRQGNANEFSKRSAKERKEIIVSILGLGIYEQVRKSAQEKIKQTTTQKQMILTLQNHRLETLKERESIAQKQKTIAQALIDIQNDYTMAAQRLAYINQEIMRVNQELHIKEQHTHDIQKITTTIQTSIEKMRNERATWRTMHIALQITPQALQEQQRAILAEKINQFQQTRHNQLIVKEKLLSVQEQINLKEHFIEQQLHTHKQQIVMHLEQLYHEQKYNEQELEKLHNHRDEIKIKLQTTSNAIETLRTTMTQLALDICNKQTYMVQFEKRKAYYQQWNSRAGIWRNQHTIINQKLSWQDSNNPSCPLCEQNLSASRKRFLQAKFAKEAAHTQHKLTRLKIILPTLKNIVLADHTYITDLQKKESEHSSAQYALNTEIQLQQDLLQTFNTITNQENIIKSKQTYFAQEIPKYEQRKQQKIIPETLKVICKEVECLKKEFEAITLDAKKITYNHEDHEQAIVQLQKLTKCLEKQEIETLRTSLYQKKQTIHTLCQSIKELRKKKQELTIIAADIPLYKEQQQKLQSEYNTTKTYSDEYIKQKEQLLHGAGILDAQQEKLEKIAEEYTQEQKKIEQCDTIITDYNAISYATSKDGIQALLIEEALPEIEHEANRLLSTLTHNNAHIMIESLRDLKKGGTKETLDIKISDAAGIRPYELFSGGEAFRIDFALRIAISKLLARRAGTSLQTLIIDEGFGSQDEEGLSLIMDALYAIQEDFAKIIIVSHLPQMKDQFPVHFYIEKIAGSSVVHIMEQG